MIDVRCLWVVGVGGVLLLLLLLFSSLSLLLTFNKAFLCQIVVGGVVGVAPSWLVLNERIALNE